jgi:hypothetical protein
MAATKINKTKKTQNIRSTPLTARWYYLDEEVAGMFNICLTTFVRNIRKTPERFPSYIMVGRTRIYPKEQPAFKVMIQPE